MSKTTTLIILLVLIVVASTGMGLLDISFNPNSWTLNYYIYNTDKLVDYTVGSPFIIDGFKVDPKYPEEVDGEWQHQLHNTVFTDGLIDEISPGINARFLFTEPFGLLNESTTWRVNYELWFTDDVITVKEVQGNKRFKQNGQASIDVVFNSRTNIDGGVSVSVGSGLFTGGGFDSYTRDFVWNQGTNVISINVPLSDLGKRTVTVKPYAYVYDNAQFGSSDLCWVVDKHDSEVCASKKVRNIPTQVRFDYYVLSESPRVSNGEVNVVFSRDDADVIIKNANDLNIFERVWEWLKTILRL